jgi:AMP-binding enzyme
MGHPARAAGLSVFARMYTRPGVVSRSICTPEYIVLPMCSAVPRHSVQLSLTRGGGSQDPAAGTQGGVGTGWSRRQRPGGSRHLALGPACYRTAAWEVLVERGVSMGTPIGADLLVPSAGMSCYAITERILALAGRSEDKAAVIDAVDGTVTAWPRFGWTIRAAAYGLSQRGLAAGDTVGVLVQDAASFAIAVNAIRAGGATALAIRPDADAADVAARLNAAGVRLLVTSAPLAELAAEAADRSRVRQVFAFGEAAGTTPFRSLLTASTHGAETGRRGTGGAGAGGAGAGGAGAGGAGAGGAGAGGAGTGGAGTGGAGTGGAGTGGAGAGGGGTGGGGTGGAGTDGGGTDGGPEGAAGLLTSLDGRAGLCHLDVVVAGPPCGDGPAYTRLLDLTLLTGATIVAAPVPLVAAAMRVYQGTAAIVPGGTTVPGLALDRVFTVALSGQLELPVK